MPKSPKSDADRFEALLREQVKLQAEQEKPKPQRKRRVPRKK